MCTDLRFRAKLPPESQQWPTHTYYFLRLMFNSKWGACLQLAICIEQVQTYPYKGLPHKLIGLTLARFRGHVDFIRVYFVEFILIIYLIQINFANLNDKKI